jgi:hypothetical protein
LGAPPKIALCKKQHAFHGTPALLPDPGLIAASHKNMAEDSKNGEKSRKTLFMLSHLSTW